MSLIPIMESGGDPTLCIATIWPRIMGSKYCKKSLLNVEKGMQEIRSILRMEDIRFRRALCRVSHASLNLPRILTP